MTRIYNPVALEPDENTFISELAFATGTGVLSATRNDGVELTESLDGRYVTSNDYLSSASFNTGDGVLTLTRTDTGTVTVDLDGRYSTNDTFVNAASFDSGTRVLTLTLNDASTVTVTISESADTNTFVNAASFDSDTGTLTLTRNDAATVTSDLDGRYVPFDLTIPSPSYALNDYTSTGFFSVDKNASNLPTGMPSWIDKLVLHVNQTGEYNGTQTLYTANGTATSEFGRIYYRKWEDAAGINWSPWTEINVGGISGDLKTSYAAADLDSATFRETGYWALGAKGAATSWPSDLSSTSDFNILQTIRSGSSGAGQQKIMCADYDTSSNPGTHIQEWKRVFDIYNETDWFEYQFQGMPISKEVYKTTEYNLYTHGNNPDTSNTRAYYVTLSGHSMSLYGFSGGYREGQLIRIFRETNSTSVTINIYANSYYATQPIYLRNGGSSLTLTSYQSAEFIYHNNIWFQQY